MKKRGCFMKKALLSGVILAGLAAASAAVMNDWDLLLKLSGAVSIASIIISGVMYGVFISREHNRDNFHTENKKVRRKGQQIGANCLLFGLPSMIAVLVYYLISGG
jgi:hypothetical protein